MVLVGVAMHGSACDCNNVDGVDVGGIVYKGFNDDDWWQYWIFHEHLTPQISLHYLFSELTVYDRNCSYSKILYYYQLYKK